MPQYLLWKCSLASLLKWWAGSKNVSGQKDPREGVVWVTCNIPALTDKIRRLYLSLNTRSPASKMTSFTFHLHPLRYSWITSCKPLKLTSSKRGSKHNFCYSVPNEFENDFPRKTARASKWGSNGEPFKHLWSACSLQQDRASRIEGGWLMYQQHQYLLDTVCWNQNKELKSCVSSSVPRNTLDSFSVVSPVSVSEIKIK